MVADSALIPAQRFAACQMLSEVCSRLVVPKPNTQRAFLCVLDIAGMQNLFGPPEMLAKNLRQRVRSLGISAQVTVCSNFHAVVRIARGLARLQKETVEPSLTPVTKAVRSPKRAKQYDAIEQGVRSADLLLQTGGFSAIVLDMGSVPPEYVARIALSTWHRYRLAAERTQSSILLLTQLLCAKSSSELQLRLFPSNEAAGDPTVFSGIQSQIEVVRQRFAQEQSNVVPLRKPPQSARMARWENPTTWAVRR